MTAADTIIELWRTKEPEVVHAPLWYNQLLMAVSNLVENDFNGLIQILYRLDVSEHKIRKALLENPGEDAAVLIAQLMLERQLQKIKSRQNFKPGPLNDDEDDW